MKGSCDTDHYVYDIAMALQKAGRITVKSPQLRFEKNEAAGFERL